MKIDLKDTTFIIPVRIDSMARLENLILSVYSILSNFRTNIYIFEASPYNNGIIERCISRHDVHYEHYEDIDPIFYKTHYLNIMARKVDTPIIGIWDADVIVSANQIIEAVRSIRDRICEVAYPYDGDFMDTSTVLREYYWHKRDVRFLKRHKYMMKALYSVEGVIGSVGGAVFISKDKYIQAGGDNEKFYGWGMEDGERHTRWLILGYRIFRVKGCLFHLTHPRDINGHFRNKEHQRKAIEDMNKTLDLTKSELEQNVR